MRHRDDGLKAACLTRDDYRCIITGLLGSSILDKSREQEGDMETGCINCCPGTIMQNWPEAREEIWKFMDHDTILIGQSLARSLEVLGIMQLCMETLWTGSGSIYRASGHLTPATKVTSRNAHEQPQACANLCQTGQIRRGRNYMSTDVERSRESAGVKASRHTRQYQLPWFGSFSPGQI